MMNRSLRLAGLSSSLPVPRCSVWPSGHGRRPGAGMIKPARWNKSVEHLEHASEYPKSHGGPGPGPGPGGSSSPAPRIRVLPRILKHLSQVITLVGCGFSVYHTVAPMCSAGSLNRVRPRPRHLWPGVRC
jgi:hypothetical protein